MTIEKIRLSWLAGIPAREVMMQTVHKPIMETIENEYRMLNAALERANAKLKELRK